jgi:hypothetical protein
MIVLHRGSEVAWPGKGSPKASESIDPDLEPCPEMLKLRRRTKGNVDVGADPVNLDVDVEVETEMERKLEAWVDCMRNVLEFCFLVVVGVFAENFFTATALVLSFICEPRNRIYTNTEHERHGQAP